MKTSFPVFIVILLAVPGFAQTAPYGPVSVVTASRTETGDAVAKKIGSELSNELTKSERVTVRIQPDGIVYRNPSQEDFIKAARAAKVPWLAIVRYQASDSENGAALVQVSHVKAESISSTATVLIVRVAKGVADVFNAALSIIQEVSGYKDVVVHLTIFVTPPDAFYNFGASRTMKTEASSGFGSWDGLRPVGTSDLLVRIPGKTETRHYYITKPDGDALYINDQITFP